MALTLNELFLAFGNGEKVRIKSWQPGEYIYLKDNNFYDREESMNDFSRVLASLSVFKRNMEWEIYKECKHVNTLVYTMNRCRFCPECGEKLVTD